VPEEDRPGVLSIDLGASYAKLSWRDAWPLGPDGAFKQTYTAGSRIIRIDGGSEVVSTAVVENTDTKDFYFGEQAKRLTPENPLRMHEEWKRALLDRKVSRRTLTNASRVAVEFFKWLRGEIERKGYPLDDAVVRVALPAFDVIDKALPLFSEIMGDAGWDVSNVQVTSEPYASALGILSAGRNHVHEDRSLTGGGDRMFVGAGEIFRINNPLMEAAHHHIMIDPGAEDELFACVVDIGSFTLDYALLRWSLDDATFQVVRQNSFRHGISNELDRPLFKQLLEPRNVFFNGLSLVERDTLKERIFSGGKHILKDSVGRNVNVGRAMDRPIINGCMKNFVQKGMDLVKRELGKGPGNEFPRWATFTGGGWQIDKVRGLFKKACVKDPKIHLLPEEDLHLLRHSTAFGGASVIIDYERGLTGKHIQPVRALPVL
jgi:hypothetical protein